MGCILANLLFNKQLFMSDDSVCDYSKSGNRPHLPSPLQLQLEQRGIFLPLQPMEMDRLHELIYSMINLEPENRPSAKSLLDTFMGNYSPPEMKSLSHELQDTIVVNSDQLRPWYDGFLVSSTNMHVAIISKPRNWNDEKGLPDPKNFLEEYRKNAFRTLVFLWDIDAEKRIWTGTQKMPNSDESAMWPVLPSFSADGKYFAAFDGLNGVDIVDIVNSRRYSKSVENNREVVAIALHDHNTLAVVSLINAQESRVPIPSRVGRDGMNLIIIPMQLSPSLKAYKVQSMFGGDGSALFVAVLVDDFITVTSYNTQTLRDTEIYRQGVFNNFQLRGVLNVSGTWRLVLWIFKSSNRKNGIPILARISQQDDEKVILLPSTGGSRTELEVKNNAFTVKDGRVWMGFWKDLAADKMWLFERTESSTEGNWNKKGSVKGMLQRNIFMGLAINGKSIAYLGKNDLDLRILKYRSNTGDARR